MNQDCGQEETHFLTLVDDVKISFKESWKSMRIALKKVEGVVVI